MFHLAVQGIVALAALAALLVHLSTAPPLATGPDFWNEVREWLIAAGTIGAVLVALLLGPFRRWWNRPKLKLSFTPNDQAAVGLYRSFDPRRDGLLPAAFARLKATNDGKSVGEGVEALVEFVGPAVVDVAPGSSPEEGLSTILTMTALSDLTLAVSNTVRPESRMTLPAGTSRHFDLADLFKGLDEAHGPLVLRFAPEPLDNRHALTDLAESVDLTIVLVAHNAAPTRYTVSVPRYKGQWPLSGAQVWENLSVESLSEAGRLRRCCVRLSAKLPWPGKED